MRFVSELGSDGRPKSWSFCAAPHRPAGHFSPYSDGEKDALVDGFASRPGCKRMPESAFSSLLPVTIRGEGAGRRMRGGAVLAKLSNCS
ncbi:MAG: hypothetical protein EOS73_26360 [Mesorhizobium sp.]|nr:hypothetical protein EOB59_26065 [Mesorhizobium sp. M7A.F.Ca.MR.176.00.0.0]RVD13995.1 hypothetical protein EN749_21430 [Mesorhizobium sp. M7A.F.Ca.ET.027.02.1.1]RVD64937.1 hypothetical protein EN750_10435 [Mesorhizobium sp. M7A.F.Ca.ET.027.03.2.1]RWC99918.1 MAG: hypothetical protein EOS73_26360 [Mesorhizobium sp.]RWO62834.1 MAG: hypothetical protein EOS17_30565 [Mesorhizobium sp.]